MREIHGLRNCHAHGVHSIVLGEEHGRLRRVFVAEPDHSLWLNTDKRLARPLSVGFHGHHCDLRITVLCGEICNLTINRFGVAGREMALYRYHSAIHDGKPSFVRLLPPVGYRTESQYMHPRDQVSLPARKFHTIWAPRGCAAAWMVEEGQEDPEYVPLTLSDDDLESFDFADMYTPMGADACEEMLRRYGLSAQRVLAVCEN